MIKAQPTVFKKEFIMPKICPGCGSQQQDTQRFCANCGTELTSVPPIQAPAPVAENVPPAAEPPYAPQNTAQPVGNYPSPPNTAQSAGGYPPAPKKTAPADKKLRVWIACVVVFAVAAILAAASGIFVFCFSGGDTSTDSDSITFSKNDKTYYVSPILFNVTDQDDPALMTVDNEKYGETFFHTDRYARIGNTMYGIDTRYGRSSADWLTKVTFSSDNQLTETSWVDSELTQHCPYARSDVDAPSDWIGTIAHMATDGKDIYFNVDASDNYYFLSQPTVESTFGKISLDGKSIEPIPGINAIDFVLDDGWIYYFDDGSYADRISYIHNSVKDVGIYKAKLDGSEKQRIYEFTFTNEEERNYSGYVGDLSGKMQIINDQIYFLDYTKTGGGRLYRINKDGSDAEAISKSSVYSYALDTDQNIVYYYVEQNYSIYGGITDIPTDINPRFCKYDIASGTETEIPHVKSNKMDLIYDNGYLYFSNNEFEYGHDSHAKSGLRMDTATEKSQWLVAYQENSIEHITNPETGRKERKENLGERKIYWEDAETKLHRDD